MALKDYYSVLDVPRSATLVQIKRSYRRLARLYHPDLNQQVPDARIKQLNEAYNVLSNTAKRAAYDILLLEEMRHRLILEAIHRQQQNMRREERMTWTEGVVGFVRELRKSMQDEA